MIEGTDSMFDTESVPSNINFLQILQNLEFAFAKFLTETLICKFQRRERPKNSIWIILISPPQSSLNFKNVDTFIVSKNIKLHLSNLQLKLLYTMIFAVLV
jgi:hypothetical protein